MFSMLKSLFNYIYEANEDDLQKEAVFVTQQLYSLDDNDSNNDNVANLDDTAKANVFFEKCGKVTFLNDEYGLIDGSLHFSTNVVDVDLKLNDKVVYLGYRLDETDTIKVSRVLSNNISWLDDEDVDGTTKDGNVDVDKVYNVGSIFNNSIVAKVIKKTDRDILIQPGNVSFSLNDVASTFIPIVGDYLQVDTKQQWLEDAPCGKQAGEVLEVNSISALRSKPLSGEVTLWQGDSNNGIGEINNKIYFTQDVCSKGYLPRIGDKVFLEAIESDQGALSWRAVLVTLEKRKEISFNNSGDGLAGSDANKDGISIIQVGDGKPIELGSEKEIQVKVENTSNRTCNMLSVRILTKVKDSQLTLVHPERDKKTRLQPGQSVSYYFRCLPKFLGTSHEKIMFVFQHTQMINKVMINVTDPFCLNMDGIKMVSNKTNTKLDALPEGRQNFIPGVRPKKAPSFIPVRLGEFPIPSKIQKIVFDYFKKRGVNAFKDTFFFLEEVVPSLTETLSFENYRKRWHALIYLEEIECKIMIAEYYMEKAFMTTREQYLCLEIAGLAERRPSLMIGDYVIAKDPSQPDKTGYQGLIHHIKSNSIWLIFHPNFHNQYTGQNVSLEFFFSRTPFRKCHQAVKLAVESLGSHFLFPKRVTVKDEQVTICTADNTIKIHNVSCDKSHIEWFNKELNHVQKCVIVNVLKGVARPLPYIIFGPPGTGKTITVVETILQILSKIQGSRILVATPSNSSANLITERLIESSQIGPGIMVRIIAHHLSINNTLPEIIKPYCATLEIAAEETIVSKMQTNSDGVQLSCPSSFIGRHRVTIGTCSALGSLARMGLPEGHFTHVIVDEAGQATEPEIMIPLTLLDPRQGQAILAGDPLQLGPLNCSRFSNHYGLGESYLARLIERFPYQQDKEGFTEAHGEYDPRLLTRLTLNYRSTPEVIKFCSKTFYDDCLKPQLSSNEGWPAALLKTIKEAFTDYNNVEGIIFYGIRGVNYQMEESPSWFNPQEASMVLMCVSKLYNAGLEPDDIGIIAPYVLQVRKIKTLFEAIGLSTPKVGSVEEFQGQERKVILVSTVRSTETLIEFDRKHCLGFLNNPRRINVTLSRAQVLTIVFGNPHLLAMDNLWKKVIQNSVDLGTYMGCDLPNCFHDNKDNDN